MFKPQVNSATVPASDSVQQTVRVNLDSGSYFDRLTWSADGNIQRMDRQGPAGSFDRRQAEGSLLYAVVPNMQLVATGGYDDIRDPSLGSGIGGIHATGGLRWSVSPRTKVTFDAGVRYRDPYYNALITYGLGRAVALKASYSVSVETPQSLASQNLNGLTRDPLGNLINPNTGLPANPNDNPFGLNDQVFRRKVF